MFRGRSCLAEPFPSPGLRRSAGEDRPLRSVDFNPVAPIYRWLEYLVFGDKLQRTRLACLDSIAPFRSGLFLGERDSRFTAALLAHRQSTEDLPNRTRSASVHLVDSSSRMMHLARLRLMTMEGIRFQIRYEIADVQRLRFEETYDLVVSHFFLDCFSTEALEDLVPRIRSAMSHGAQWIVSEFDIPAKTPFRTAARLLIHAMYVFFNITAGLANTQLPAYRDVLNRNRLKVVMRRWNSCGLLVSEIWETY